MKNFPSIFAVIGAWFCAFGIVWLGLIFFIASSLWAILIDEDHGTFTLLFLGANVYAFFRILDSI